MAAPARRRFAAAYKVALLGQQGVGKTSLFRRLNDNTFDEYHIDKYQGIDSCTKVVKVDGETVMLSIRDGSKHELRQEWFRDGHPCNLYYRAHAAVFVYSVSEASSLHYLNTVAIEYLPKFAPNAVWMLIGNKVDLKREVDPANAIYFAAVHEFQLHFEISCKTNSCIEEAFERLARVLHKPRLGSPEMDAIINRDTVEPGKCR